jgi:hypothetical protein
MIEQERVTTTKLSLAVIVGSVRQPRVGRVIANWFVDLAARRMDLAIDLMDLAEVTLPLADTQPGGSATSPIADRLASADAYVIVTPEYNHSFPAALKNAIDWHYREWMFKPVAFVSYGAGRRRADGAGRRHDAGRAELVGERAALRPSRKALRGLSHGPRSTAPRRI